MALFRVFLAEFLMAVLVLRAADAGTESSYQRARDMIITSRRSLLATIDCCSARGRSCAASSRPNLCVRACGSYCAKCDCVPSGTSGDYQECPCYTGLTTHGGRKKCP